MAGMRLYLQMQLHRRMALCAKEKGWCDALAAAHNRPFGGTLKFRTSGEEAETTNARHWEEVVAGVVSTLRDWEEDVPRVTRPLAGRRMPPDAISMFSR